MKTVMITLLMIISSILLPPPEYTKHVCKGDDKMAIVTKPLVLDETVKQFNQDLINILGNITKAEAKAAEAANSANEANNAKDASIVNAAEADRVAQALTTFLQSKQTLTAPAIDATLSVSGAGADAKVVGDKCLKSSGYEPYNVTTFNNLPTEYKDLNTVPINSVVCYTNNVVNLLENIPPNLKTTITVMTYSPLNSYAGAVQLLISFHSDYSTLFIRTNGGTWTEWTEYDNTKVLDNIYKSLFDIDIINYFDETKLIDGFVNNGFISYASGWKHTDYIPISYMDSIRVACTNGSDLTVGCYYDENYKFIANTGYGKNVKQPFSFHVNLEQAKYFVYNVYPSSFSYSNQYCYVAKEGGYVFDLVNVLKSIKYNAKENSIYYVGANRVGENTFKTLKNCTEYIIANNIYGAKVYVDAGVYDLAAEYGQEYLDTINLNSNKGIGLHVGNNTHYIFAGGSKVTFNYTGENTSIYYYFAPFNVTGSVTLENCVIECANCRYCVHEDLPTSSDVIPDNYTAKYINCYMHHLGNTNIGGGGVPICIGAGTNRNSISIIEGGKYIAAEGQNCDISYHNHNQATYGGNGSKIIVKNVYLDKGLVAAWEFGTSNTDVEVSGCFLGNGMNSDVRYGTYNKSNIIAWNNTKRY